MDGSCGGVPVLLDAIGDINRDELATRSAEEASVWVDETVFEIWNSTPYEEASVWLV